MKAKDAKHDARKLAWIGQQFGSLSELLRSPEEGGGLENHCRNAVGTALARIGIEMLDDGTVRWRDYRGVNQQYLEPWDAQGNKATVA